MPSIRRAHGWMGGVGHHRLCSPCTLVARWPDWPSRCLYWHVLDELPQATGPPASQGHPFRKETRQPATRPVAPVTLFSLVCTAQEDPVPAGLPGRDTGNGGDRALAGALPVVAAMARPTVHLKGSLSRPGSQWRFVFRSISGDLG